MKTLVLFIVVALTVCLVLAVVYTLDEQRGVLRGSAFDPSFSNATSSFRNCTGGASTSTLVEATTTGRTSFQASHTSTTGATYLCRGLTCAAGNGLVLNVNTPPYIQEDSYYGPYSCFGTGAGGVTGSTTTLGVWTSN